MVDRIVELPALGEVACEIVVSVPSVGIFSHSIPPKRFIGVENFCPLKCQNQKRANHHHGNKQPYARVLQKEYGRGNERQQRGAGQIREVIRYAREDHEIHVEESEHGK